MFVFITWVCLGGGLVMILAAVITISRLQDRTRQVEDEWPDEKG